MPKLIGSINCYVSCGFRYDGKQHIFDGTLKGLCLSAQKWGAVAGSIVEAEFGGNYQKYVLESVPHDNRANFLWPMLVKD